MSKRQANGVFKARHIPGRMTKGDALILARGIVGPDVTVRVDEFGVMSAHRTYTWGKEKRHIAVVKLKFTCERIKYSTYDSPEEIRSLDDPNGWCFAAADSWPGLMNQIEKYKKELDKV